MSTADDDQRLGAVRLESGRGVLTATLARPERGNMIDAALLAGLGRALDLAEADADCRMLVLRGADGVFCSGLDFAAVAAENGGDGSDTGGGDEASRSWSREFYRLLERLTRTPRVVVAVVDGQALGGGVGLVAASDLVLATERSTFGLPEALWGLLPCVVLPFLLRRVGFQNAYAMALTTQSIDARQAHRIALVDELAPAARAPLARLAFRMARVDVATIGAMKDYFGRLAPLPPDAEAVAVGEFARLLGGPVVRRRIADFAAEQRFPWQRQQTPPR
ncbi:MAG: enoyl-CoA hydratase [Catenulispora sp.]|nr:enoyl-CoA hydratase [Catenulispora sp.]